MGSPRQFFLSIFLFYFSKNLEKYDLSRPKVTKYWLTSWPEVIVRLYSPWKYGLPPFFFDRLPRFVDTGADDMITVTVTDSPLQSPQGGHFDVSYHRVHEWLLETKTSLGYTEDSHHKEEDTHHKPTVINIS